MMNDDDEPTRLDLLVRISELSAQLALKNIQIDQLRGEIAYLETIKDPLRDNIGWSPLSDLTFD